MAWNEPGSGNRDPWNQGGKGNNQGPPDLDEMLKRFKARFSGKGGGGGRSGPGLPLAGGAGLIGGVIALLWVLSGFYTVDEQQRAVVFRFGAYVGTTEPGLRWHLPWPVESHEKVNLTGIRSITDSATMLTQDENIVDVELSVQYRVRDGKAMEYVVNVADPDLSLRQATKAAVREVVGQNKMDVILTDGREAVADRIKQLLQDRLDEYNTGLVVSEVNLKNVQPPEAVQAAFADATKAREDLERLKNEAQAYANERLPRARGAAARELAEATAYREQIVAKANGDAARFTSLVGEYRKAPQVTRERLYLDTMSEVMGKTSKVVVDVDQGSPMIYLPLDQLLKNQPKTIAPLAAPEATPPTRAESYGDATRSRDRSR